MRLNMVTSGFAIFLISLAIFAFGLSTIDITFPQVIVGIIRECFYPVAEVLFAYMCLIGAGYLATLFLLKKNDKSNLHPLELIYCYVLFGAMLVSGLLFLLGISGSLYPEVLLLLKIGFSLVGVHAISMRLVDNDGCLKQQTMSSLPEKTLKATVIFFVLLVFFGASTSPVIFVDAMAYHFGLPLLFIQNHAINFYPTIAGSGQYLAGDMLYLLTLHSSDPFNIFATKLFNASLEAILFVATFLSVRRNGVSGTHAYIACILLFSIPAIYLWGTGKNDLFIAGLAISVLWMFRIFETYRSDVWLYCMFLIGGFAVSVKILAAPIILIGGVFLFAFFIKEKLSIKKYFIACGIGAIPVIPWALYAFHYRESPVYPIGGFEISGYSNSAFYLAESALRNASGLSLTVGNIFKQIIPLIAGISNYSRGNYTSALGWTFIAAAIMGMLCLVNKDTRKYSFFWVVGVLNLVLLVIAYFES